MTMCICLFNGLGGAFAKPSPLFLRQLLGAELSVAIRKENRVQNEYRRVYAFNSPVN